MSNKKQVLQVRGTAVWAKLFEPDTKFDSVGVYTINVVAPADDPNTVKVVEKLTELAQAEYDRAVEEKPALKKQLTIRSVVEDEYHHETGEETGNVIFKLKLKAGGTRKDGTKFTQKPIVVDAKRNKLTEANVGNGSVVNAAFECVPYTMASTKQAGVSLRLKGVQIIELVEFGSDVSSIFDEVDGYEAEESSDEGVFSDTSTDDNTGDDNDGADY